MDPLVLALWALFGALGGALAFRLADLLLEAREADAPIGWRPRCPRCGRPESLLRRLALLALPLRLRCAGCGLAPAREQVAVELVGAAGVALLAWRYEEPLQAGIHALAALLLLTATLTDLRARLIPNRLTYPGSLAALGAAALPGGVGLVEAAAGGLASGLIALGMLLLGVALYRRADVFGMGDVKLALFIGLVAGLSRAVVSLLAGILAGGVIGVAVLLAGRSRRSTMPYGPALALGAYAVMVLRPL
jgi:leader peptidase (prepilin peptidase)/N-methyltransferase